MDPTDDGIIEVRVLDAPGLEGGCGCGSPPATAGKEEAATIHDRCEELRTVLEARFPGRTRVEYRNLLEHPEEKETPAGQVLIHRMFPPPIVAIAGQPKFAGSVQVNRIVGSVGKLLES